jgi:hypothetical protein
MLGGLGKKVIWFSGGDIGIGSFSGNVTNLAQ